MSKIEVNTIDKASGSSVTIGGSGTNVVLGTSGQTVSVASGVTTSGMGRTGTVDWQTTVKTGNFTASNGEGYFINTSGGAVTATLPASPSAGSIVAFKDYGNTFDTNNLTIGRNSSKIGGDTEDATQRTKGASVTLIFTDSTKGWLVVNDGLQSQAPTESFMTATGGTISESGNFKIHTFTSPGTFQVTAVGNTPACNQVDYMVVAGGGGGSGGPSGDGGGGGGAGGYRESPGAKTCYSASPLGASPAVALPVSVASFPVTVGAGGTGTDTFRVVGGSGSSSAFAGSSTITSAGGGGGGGNTTGAATGGSGGGAGSGGGGPFPGAAGNTPPTNPAQGNPGGSGSNNPPDQGAGGGGGAAGSGGNHSGNNGGNGGASTSSSITSVPVARAGGGGGMGSASGNGGSATGGGGSGGKSGGGSATSATVNTGSGGGGAGNSSPESAGGNGGSGIVVIRYKFQ